MKFTFIHSSTLQVFFEPPERTSLKLRPRDVCVRHPQPFLVYELMTKMAPDRPFLSWMVHVTLNSTSPATSFRASSKPDARDMLGDGRVFDHKGDVLYDLGV